MEALSSPVTAFFLFLLFVIFQAVLTLFKDVVSLEALMYFNFMLLKLICRKKHRQRELTTSIF